MPTAFTCENCGTNSWNRKPSDMGLVMYPHIMRDGRYCPVCGDDFESDSKSKDEAGIVAASTRYSETEREDAKKMRKAVSALEKHDVSTCRQLLREVAANAPSKYEYSYEEGEKYYIKCWDLAEFDSYKEAVQNGSIPDKGSAVWLQSSYPLAYYYLAFLDVEAGQFVSARSYLEKALALEPDSPQLLFEMGLTLGHIHIEAERSIEFFDRALSARPHMNARLHAKILRGKGIQLIDLGELDRAEESLGESLLYDPEDKLAHHELAYIDYLRSGGESLPTAGVSRREGTSKKEPQLTMEERLRKAGMVELLLPPEKSGPATRETTSGRNEPEPQAASYTVCLLLLAPAMPTTLAMMVETSAGV